MITFSNVSFRYKRSARPVFRGLNLQLAPGRVYGLLGENGTGKSTLLGLMSGLLRPLQGTVTAHVPGAECPSDRRPEFLREVFLLPEEFDFPRASLQDYIRINAPFYPRFSASQLEQNLSVFGLGMDLRLDALSMGEKKKVLICFALAAGTRLLLMDEPTNGLDIPAKQQFRRVMAQAMTEDRTVVISTHQVHDVAQLLDHILILSHSRLAADDLLVDAPVDAITARYAFELCPTGTATAGALYAEPAVQGQAVVRQRADDEPETDINLELLFNAVCSGAVSLALPPQVGQAEPPVDAAPTETADGPQPECIGVTRNLLRYTLFTYRRWAWGVLLLVIAFCCYLFYELGGRYYPDVPDMYHGHPVTPAEMIGIIRYYMADNIVCVLVPSFFFLGGIFVYAGMADNRSRTTWLLLPAGNLQKTLVRLACVVGVGVSAILVGVALSDGIRAALSYFMAPVLAKPLYGEFLKSLVNVFSDFEWAFDLFFFAAGMLGSAFFRRWAWAWILMSFVLFRLAVGVVGSMVMPLFGIDTEPEFHPYFMGFCLLMTPVCFWLSHRLFCRWQLDSRRFTNL